MNYSKNDIEYYLLNKEYIELNKAEKVFISKEINSEEEFNELKKLFSSFSNNSIDNNPLEPDPTIKTNLINEFRQHNNQNKIWLNSFFTTLFPKDKKFISMPGTQLAGIAASLLIIMTIYTNFEINNSSPSITLSEDQIEILGNDHQITSEPILKTNQDAEISDNKNITLAKNEETETSKNEILLNSDTEETIVVIEKNDLVESEASEDAVLSELDDFEGSFKEDELVLSGFSTPSISSNKELTPNVSEVIEKDFKIITTSRSLKEDEELIDLFYTAL